VVGHRGDAKRNGGRATALWMTYRLDRKSLSAASHHPRSDYSVSKFIPAPIPAVEMLHREIGCLTKKLGRAALQRSRVSVTHRLDIFLGALRNIYAQVLSC
jgi:hypothetical protein